MSSLMDVYRQVCIEDLIPKKRQKDILTAVRYLAAASDSTPERLELTDELESTYNARLRSYLAAQHKGPSTIRASIQGIGQLLRAYHQLPKKAPLPHAKGRPKLVEEAIKGLATDSPYQHWAWLIRTPYYLRLDQWPAEVRTPFEKYRQLRKDHHIRDGTLDMQSKAIEAYLGYLRMDGDQRLTYLAPEARTKLAHKRYKDDLDAITSVPSTCAWNALFVVDHLKSFVTWQSWRIHTPEDAQVIERPPSKLSAKAKVVGETILRLAQHLPRKKDIKPIAEYLKHLPEPRKIHNKRADYHQFSCEELERVALTLMEEARGMVIAENVATYHYPGVWPASRFALGLVLMLGWRIPIRVRNWSEALIGTNLRNEGGVWHWHFEGDELKIGKRNGETNVYDVEINPEVVPYLEEYLNVWRPRLPHADTDRHLLLNARGGHGRLPPKALYLKLRMHVFRLTGGKRIYPHLLRTLFVSHAINSGMDLNSVAFIMNDKPETVLQAYNEVNAQHHTQASHDFSRRMLKNGNGKAS